jgi:uncharacterized protein YbjT (DUF2867 family)
VEDNRLVLITGSTGFVGSRLVTELLSRGKKLRLLIRKPSTISIQGIDVTEGDLLRPLSLQAAFKGVDTAYYLVHSMSGGRAGFERRDREAAVNFRNAAEKAGVRRVIYLGGLGEKGEGLSEHLTSRLEVARILQEGKFSTTFLRAAVIVGAGSASFEMIRALVERLPIMITPKWVSTRCQPIAISNVISYLAECLDSEATTGKTFDIGGPEILTYREMMERFAAVSGRKLFIAPVPFLTPTLSSYWVTLITPVKPSVSMPLIEGLANEVICRDTSIRDLIPIQLTGFNDAVINAIEEDQRQ